MIESVGAWVINIISNLGYPGIVITMAIESALIPLPSEIIMPFSGYLVSTGKFGLWQVALAGAFGNVLGSLAAYALGYWGQERLIRKFVRRFGKWVLLTEEELDKAEKLLNKYNDWVVIGSRVIPGVRTIISLPAGFAKLPLGRFIILTFAGSFVWSLLLAWIGFLLGSNWKTIGPYFHKADILVGIVILGIAVYYIYHKLKK